MHGRRVLGRLYFLRESGSCQGSRQPLPFEGVGSGGGRVFRESQEHAGALARENLRAKGWLGAKSLLVVEVHGRHRELLPSPT